MIIHIPPKSLHYHLRQKDPLLYFYNGNGILRNSSIVENMKKYSNIHCQIKVIQIDWKEQLKYNSTTKINLLNNVYYYALGQFVLRKEEPDEMEIKSMFDEAIKTSKIVYERKRIELLKKLNIPYEIKIRLHNEVINKEMKRCNNVKEINPNQNNIKKFKIPHTHNQKKYINLKVKSTGKCNDLENNNNIIYKFKNNIFKRNEKLIKDDTFTNLKEPWYHEVNTNDLPSDILDDKFDNYQMITNKSNINDMKTTIIKSKITIKKSLINDRNEIHVKDIKMVNSKNNNFIHENKED